MYSVEKIDKLREKEDDLDRTLVRFLRELS